MARWRVKYPPGHASGPVAAGGIADAGLDKRTVLPAQDVSLFGRITDWSRGPYVVAWTQVSGPTTATMSAPWALAQNVTVPVAGTYVFQLSVTDSLSRVGADTVSVVVRATSDATVYYVDPDYTGGSEDGSAAHPWTMTQVGGDTLPAVWTSTIQPALLTNDVVIFCAARKAASDTAMTTTAKLLIWRPATDTGPYQLVVDGQSRYKQSNGAGDDWTTYAGTNRFSIATGGAEQGFGVLGTGTSLAPYLCTNMTWRGFDMQNKVGGCGDNWRTENFSIHDTINGTPGLDPGAPAFLVHNAVETPSCFTTFNNRRGMTVYNCTLARTAGEGLYIGGTYLTVADGGCTTWGYTHSDILLERNTVTDAGSGGAEGNAFDLKAGLRYVTVRGNTVTYPTFNPNAALFTSSGVNQPTDGPTVFLIENNQFIAHPSSTGVNIVVAQFNGLVIRNNILKYGGIDIDTKLGDGTIRNKNGSLYNNTGYLAGLNLQWLDNGYLRNNIFNWGSTAVVDAMQAHGSCTNIDSDYTYYPSENTTTNWSFEGTHPTNKHSLTGATAFFVDPATNDFHLNTGVAPIDAGIDISAGLGTWDTRFTTDFEGTTRPIGAAWDIGADEKAP